MGQSYFVWKGVDCRAMGVWMQGPAPIIRPEERAKHVQIPGRSGDYTETEGDNIYNSYIQTVSLLVKNGMRVREIYKWLRGSGYVTFSGEPDRKQKARVIGAVTLNKHSRHLDWWTGEAQFYCQPLKEKLHETVLTGVTSGSVVYNEGDVIARPRYKITAGATSFSLSVVGEGINETITATNVVSGNSYYIDSDAMEMTNVGGGTLLTRRTTGPFPRLAPGSNTITGSGITSLEILRRERFL